MPSASPRSIARASARASATKGFSFADFTPEDTVKEVVVNFPKGKLHLTFDTANLTMEFNEALEAAGAENSVTKMQDLIFGQVTKWDLIDPATGELAPIEPAVWRKMHPQMFWKIVETFTEQVGAPKTETSNG